MKDFRKLKANEIDVRVGNVAKDKTWITLLLYKNARVDMDVLDEAVGKENWQREHKRDNANCVVSIYDDAKKEWVSKEDTGTESFSDAEKGLASDSFKRACVNWGIGRELYTAPVIFLRGNAEVLKKDTYSVKEIEYNDDREITKIVIVNKKGEIVFPAPTSKKETSNKPINADQIKKIHTLIGNNDDLKEAIYKKYNIKSCKELTEVKAKEMILRLEKGIEKKKKKASE